MPVGGPGDLVKFEQRTIDLTTPVKGPRHSFFGTLFQGLAAVSAPAAFFPGIGTAIWASSQGLGVMGNHMQNKAMHPSYETTAAPGHNPVVYPGMAAPAAVNYNAAAVSSDPALSIITARTASMSEIPQAIGGAR